MLMELQGSEGCMALYIFEYNICTLMGLQGSEGDQNDHISKQEAVCRSIYSLFIIFFHSCHISIEYY
jgi:hypothetical protein